MKRPAFPLPMPPKRTRKSASANARHKLVAKASGRLACEICGFFDNRYPPFGLLESHHIRPRSAGGQDISSNYIILCPTHHAVADRLSRADHNLTRPVMVAMLSRNFVPSNPPANSMETHMAEVSSDAIRRFKAELLRVPVSAYANALKNSDEHRMQGHEEVADTYAAVAAELKAEGHAPDESGNLGHATAAHYKGDFGVKSHPEDKGE